MQNEGFRAGPDSVNMLPRRSGLGAVGAEIAVHGKALVVFSMPGLARDTPIGARRVAISTASFIRRGVAFLCPESVPERLSAISRARRSGRRFTRLRAPWTRFSGLAAPSQEPALVLLRRLARRRRIRLGARGCRPRGIEYAYRRLAHRPRHRYAY